MKAFLMYPDRDLDLQQELPPEGEDLIRDLELDVLFGAMADGDPFLLEVARKAMLASLHDDVEAVLHRQHIVADCLANAAVVRALYGVATAAVEGRKKHLFGVLSHYPIVILHDAIELLQMFVGHIGQLKAIVDEHAGQFRSEGFCTLFALLSREFGEAYFAEIEDHLAELRFRKGVLLSAGLGKGNKASGYVVRRAPPRRQGWWERLFARKPPAYVFRIADRDEAGANALSQLQGRGINLVANALAQSTDHVLSFFEMLRAELAFYVGCLNLHQRLAERGAGVVLPTPWPAGARRRSFSGLYDACLALSMERRVVGNAANADGKRLVIVTGANQGGKSSFLRSIGLAQLMMQSGMFVAAQAFEGELCDGLFTHYRREEDATLRSGKLDEELGRMSRIVDRLRPNSMLLCNESFAATNEREGSEIARQIVGALLEKRVRIFFVTHLYHFAHECHLRGRGDALFLRAERRADGTRTFRLIEGEPLATSFGQDLYRRIFEDEAACASA